MALARFSFERDNFRTFLNRIPSHGESGIRAAAGDRVAIGLHISHDCLTEYFLPEDVMRHGLLPDVFQSLFILLHL